MRALRKSLKRNKNDFEFEPQSWKPKYATCLFLFWLCHRYLVKIKAGILCESFPPDPAKNIEGNILTLIEGMFLDWNFDTYWNYSDVGLFIYHWQIYVHKDVHVV